METKKRILDEETRRQLIGYVPFSTKVTIDITPEQFDKIADKNIVPVFSVRSLTQGEMQEIRSNYALYNEKSTSDNLQAIAEKNSDIIRHCVTGWINLFDAGTGEEIDFDGKECSRELWDLLPQWLQAWLMNFIRKISGMSNADELGLK